MALRSRTLGFLVPLGALTLLGLVSASRMYFGYAKAGHPISAGDALGSGLLEWGLWAPLLPAIRALARRFAPLENQRPGDPWALALKIAWISSRCLPLVSGTSFQQNQSVATPIPP